MCVIIHKPANVLPSFSSISSACDVNPAGWGLMTADRGKLEIIKEFNPDGNNPDEVYRALENVRNMEAFLHLRYVTAGDENLANCHPFPVLTQAENDVDIALMHNGTLYAFDYGDDMSDTFHFASDLVAPLLKRFIQFTGEDAVLSDHMTEAVLKEFIGSTSVVALFDGYGGSLIINQKNGIEIDGCWASNGYSFKNDYSRRTSSSSTRMSSTDWRSRLQSMFDEDQEPTSRSYARTSTGNLLVPVGSTNDNKTGTGSQTTTETQIKAPPQIPVDYQISSLKETIASVDWDGLMNPSEKLVTDLTSDYRASFCELSDLKSLDLLCALDPDDLVSIRLQYPDMYDLLVQDLLAELFLRRKLEKETASIVNKDNKNIKTKDVTPHHIPAQS